MIKSLKVTNYLGDSMTFELGRPEESGFAITSITGLGPVKAIINTTEVSTRDGSMYNSARAGSRNIVIAVRFLWKDTIEDARQLSYRYFPLKQKLNLQIQSDNRTLSTDGYVESNEPSIFSRTSGTVISIICPSSFFYEPNKTQTTVFSGVEPGFEFPFSNESLTANLIEFSSSQVLAENVVVYNGDAETGITIYIHMIGDAGSITIYNVKTREKMRIDASRIASSIGEGIIAKDDIIIRTEQGSKSVSLIRDGVTHNILNCIDRDMDWFMLSKGDNVFTYVADFGAENIQFKIENEIIYEGV